MGQLATASRIRVQCAESIDLSVCDPSITPAIGDKLLTTVYNRVMIVAFARFKVGDLVTRE